jgi:RND family efflux transporter MFP subunit
LATKPKIVNSNVTKIALPIMAALMILGIAGWYYSSRSNVSAQTTSLQEGTAAAGRGDLLISASGSGTLIAQAGATFGFDTSGQVTDVYVKVGDQVEAGEVLAQLDDTLAQMKYEEAQQALQELYSAASIATVKQEIATAQDTEAAAREWLAYLTSPEVAEAEENLAIAQQALADAQAAAKANPTDSADQAVREKEQAVAFLSDKLAQAQEYYENYYLPENFGEYENIGSRRHPKQVLATTVDPVTGEEVPEINEPSTDDLAVARNDLAQAQQTISEGQAYLDILNSGVIPDNAVGERVTAFYETQLDLENAKSALDDTQLIAPISGIVTSLDLSVGEQTGTSPVITISQLSQPYTLDVYLEEADWDMAQVGNQVNVTFDLLPEQSYTGTVTLVYPELSPSFETSLVHLLVQLEQSLSQDLPAGTGATVEVIGGEAKSVVLVSVDAIHKGEDRKTFVTVFQNGEQVEREVEIGLQNDTYVEVKSGLQPGEIVVTE